MSTAGKVLVVLVALVMVAWIILFSMIGLLNRNWGERIAALEAEKAKLEVAQPKAEDDVETTLAEIDAIQVDKIQKTRVLRTAVEDREGLLFRTKEALAADKIRLEKWLATVATAQEDVKRRTEEKAATEKALADQRAEVEKLKAETAEQLAKLTGLQDDFKRILADSQQQIRQTTGAGPRVRSASFVTP